MNDKNAAYGMIPIESIIPYERNPRKISAKAIESVKKSIRMNGARDPIEIDEKGVCLAGHTRLKAYKELGYTEVPVIQHMDMTETQKKTYRIASNKTGEYSEWDDELLAAELKDIDQSIAELNESTGLSEKELREAIDEHDESDDDVPVPRETDIKIGDVFTLGRHRIMCGDSTSASDVALLMDGKKADMVFTDPPYGVSYSKKNEFLNSIDEGNRIQEEIENDNMTLEETRDKLIYPSFCNLRTSLKSDGVYYITSPQGGDLLMMMMMMIEKSGLKLRHMLIWCKNNHVLGRTDYNYKHEPIFYGWNEKHHFYGAGKHLFSTWEIDKRHSSELHPTMKPIELIENALLNSTERGMMLVDLFLGSGSSVIAAQNTGRICYGMEISPQYCQVIIDRYKRFTGRDDVVKCVQ